MINTRFLCIFNTTKLFYSNMSKKGKSKASNLTEESKKQVKKYNKVNVKIIYLQFLGFQLSNKFR